VTLSSDEEVFPNAQKYLNRLSDLLFVIARVLARVDGGQEVVWEQNRSTRVD